MKRRGLEPLHDTHINVTPLIDVVMCLIIFFLVCGRLAQEESNDQVIIPRASLGQDLPEQRGRLLINVVPRNRIPGIPLDPAIEPEIIIRGQPLSQASLTAYLQKEKKDNPDIKVILRADQEIAYNWIAPILTSCATADIKSVNFSTKKE